MDFDLTSPGVINEAKREILFRALRNNPWLFFEKFVYTLDPHYAKQPVRRYPVDKPYLKEIVKLCEENNLLLIEKSRQMLVTWTIVGFFLWDAIFHNGRYIFFQSRKEDDAGLSTPLSLVSRAKFIFDHLPKELQCPLRIGKQPPIMQIGDSTIQGISQDSDALRSFTASGVFADEMAFQERSREAFAATRPTIEGGGRFIGVSSAHGKNFWYQLTHDLEE